LHFALDEELISAASSEPVASALLHKVSRERVYKELDGMMNTSTSRPYVAFALMYR
jgi:tRNA nucleotidyltransferase/poly(A) polymerase